jgi:HD-GYP domain-containing protein (c-di-GMP phosphodiesterase class II)
MTSDRAYRKGMPHEKAMEIIRDGSGSQWDSEVVEAFLAVIDDITAIRYGYTQIERPARKGAALTPTCRS